MILTTTTGIVDAVSFVGLGRVFTANMTGNVVFLGFALGGVEGLSVERSLIALAAFATGALVGGRLANRSIRPPAQQLTMAAAAEAVLLAGAAIVGFGEAPPPSSFTTHALIVLTAIAMGMRNAVVRKLGVADVTTTVLTLTITGLAADSALAGGSRPRQGRRVVSILCMFVGALAGTAILHSWGFTPPLTLASLLAAGVSVGALMKLRASVPAALRTV
jgi:uncharacterized membrane protein YoaK (UPF0700 family)